MSNIERESAQVTLEPNQYDNKSTASPFKASPTIKKLDKMGGMDIESAFGTEKDARFKMTDMHSNIYSRQSGEPGATIAHSTRGVVPTEMGNDDINSHFDFMKDSQNDINQSEKKQIKLLN